ncbi:hypothetical protein ACFU76_25085, partial [Streptomyces sp. NPDC057539]|uniref:hypothetical protein n=1 Tax=Streptomyces sp. NPDC057539 TaxID=3346159 RepID=UPI0036832631
MISSHHDAHRLPDDPAPPCLLEQVDGITPVNHLSNDSRRDVSEATTHTNRTDNPAPDDGRLVLDGAFLVLNK